MAHLSNVENLSHLPEHIEACDPKRLIYQIKHRKLMKFWIDSFSRVIQKSWSMCPCELPALDESTITDNIEVTKIKEHRSDDIFS